MPSRFTIPGAPPVTRVASNLTEIPAAFAPVSPNAFRSIRFSTRLDVVFKQMLVAGLQPVATLLMTIGEPVAGVTVAFRLPTVLVSLWTIRRTSVFSLEPVGGDAWLYPVSTTPAVRALAGEFAT